MNFSEATTGGVLWKKLFLKIPQYSQESCRRATLLKRDSNATQMFSSEYYEIFKGNAQFVQKVTFKPLMDFKKKKFTSPKLSKQTITFFWDSAFLYFHESNINRWFWRVTQKYELRVSFKNNYFEKHILTGYFWFFKTAVEQQWVGASVLILNFDN